MGGEGGLGAGMCECFEAAYLIQFQGNFQPRPPFQAQAPLHRPETSI